MIIRPETPEDYAAICEVNELAFGRPAEAGLVSTLRRNGRATLSLVAVREGEVAGHILFFPLTIQGAATTHHGATTHAALGLGPMAVRPAFQKQGIGSALVRFGIEALAGRGHPAVIVLGHPWFYPRLGFVPASTFGLTSKYQVPDEVFMTVELIPGGLSGKSGAVIYSPEFDAV